MKYRFQAVFPALSRILTGSLPFFLFLDISPANPKTSLAKSLETTNEDSFPIASRETSRISVAKVGESGD